MYHRVTIDLSQHFSNYKKKCAILLREEWTTVEDLQNYVKEIFKLKKIEFIDVNNDYIPATESINIIKRNGLLELTGVGIKSRSSKEIKLVKDNNISNVFDSNHKSKISTESYENNVCSSNEVVPLLKRKRKRNKKYKENSTNQQTNLSINTASINLPVNELPKHHLRFDEFGNSDLSVVWHHKKINFKNFLDTQNPSKARMIKTIVAQKKQQEEDISENNIDNFENSDNQQFTENNVIVTENKIINNGFELLKNALCQENSNTNSSPMDKKSDGERSSDSDDVVFVKSINNSEENLHTIFQHEDKMIKHHKIYSISESLNCQPEIENIIFFKIYTLNEEHLPCLSDYICGKVECIIESGNENYLKIYIVDGQAELKEHPRTIQDCDVNTEYLQIKFSELYEPRILNYNLKNSI